MLSRGIHVIIPISHVLDLQMWKRIMGVSTAFLLRFINELKFASRKSPRPERNGSADLLEHVSGTIPIARMTLGTSHSKAVCNVAHLTQTQVSEDIVNGILMIIGASQLQTAKNATLIRNHRRIIGE